MGKRGAELSGKWKELFESYRADDPEKAAHWEAMQRRELPEGWDADIPSFEPDEKGTATRKASNKVENAVAARVPWLVAGAADLTGSNSVELEGQQALRAGIARGAPVPLRHPGARVRRDLERALALEDAAAVVHLPDLLRLRPARRSGSPR